MSVFDFKLLKRRLPTERLNALLSKPPKQEEIDLLKHIDLERICRLFDMFFTEHRTYDYTQPIRRLVGTKADFNLYEI